MKSVVSRDDHDLPEFLPIGRTDYTELKYKVPCANCYSNSQCRGEHSLEHMTVESAQSW